jgi:formylglycine-generating enzyme
MQTFRKIFLSFFVLFIIITFVQAAFATGRSPELSIKNKAKLLKKNQKRESYTDPVTGMEFIWIKGGCFQMGQTNNGKKEIIAYFGENYYKNYYIGDLPRHEVCLDGFYMAKYEVTNQQYRMYKPAHDSKDYEGHSLNGENHPVVYVSWNDAKGYIKWLNSKTGKTYGLPSEAQWEYAARGGTTSIRHWGDDPDKGCDYANVLDLKAKQVLGYSNVFKCNDGYAFTAPVGSYKPNPFGLYDMQGNVLEWCQDWHSFKYYRRSPRNNPKGALKGHSRIFRGSSYHKLMAQVREAVRSGYGPTSSSFDLGIRLIMLSGQQ